MFATFSRKQTISMSHSDTKTIGLQKSDMTLEVCYRRLDVLLDRLLCFCSAYEKDTRSLERSLVAYKGSLIQRRWLTSRGMPHIDLAPLGSPKFSDLPRLSSVASCGQHEQPLQIHCPQVECYHFVQWMSGQRGLNHDTRYINHERTQRFLAAQKPRTCLRPMSTQPHYRHFRFCPEHM